MRRMDDEKDIGLARYAEVRLRDAICSLPATVMGFHIGLSAATVISS